MRWLLATVICILAGAVIAGVVALLPSANTAPQQEYIDKSYYDLREEKKALFGRSRLTADDTTAKKEAVMRSLEASFRGSYVGKYVKWTGGYVSDVEEEDGQFICKIEMDGDTLFSTADIRFPVPQDVAVALKRQREVLLDGKILALEGTLKVQLQVNTIAYTGRTLDDMVRAESQNRNAQETP